MSVQSFQLASASKSFDAGVDGWLSAVYGVRLWSETEITTSSTIYLVRQPSRHFHLNLAKIPPNQVIADFGR